MRDKEKNPVVAKISVRPSEGVAEEGCGGIKEKEIKLSVISQKLERLLTGYLDQVIDEQDYRTEKSKLLLSKKSLEEEISSFSHKQNDWLAPPPRRKKIVRRLRRRTEFVWKIRQNSVGGALRRPQFGL